MTLVAHDPLAVLLHQGDAFSTVYRRGPAFESRLTAESWTITTGDPHWIWNWVGLTSASPANVAVLRDFVGQVRERRAEGLVFYAPDVGPDLALTFRELGLGEPGRVPLMTCVPADLPPLEPAEPVSDHERVRIDRVSDPATLAAAVKVAATCFDIPPDQADRCLGPALLAEPAVTVFAARLGDRVVEMLASTRFGDTVSIDLMAVDPTVQRRGVGRTLMLHVMHRQIATGVTGIHLLSSDAGFRLYDQIGFTTLLTTLTRFIPLDPIPPGHVVA